MKIKKNENGFGLIEALLIIIALALVVFVGYYIYQNQQESKESEVAPKSTSVKTEDTSKDPTENWTEYTSSAGKYSLKYPADWVTASNPELCEEKTFLVGPTKDTVGGCASDGAGEVIFYSYTVESGAEGLADEYYDNFETKTAKADGVTGYRESGTIKADPEGLGSPKGTKEVAYVFKKNGQIYLARYTQKPTDPDVEKDFDLIVTKTLKFNN